MAGKEGFVARLDVGLVSTALDRASYLGSSQDDIVKSIAVVDGEVYASGVSGGLIAGQGASKSATSFISRLDDTGEVDWMRSFSSSAGQLTLTTMAVDESGTSALDILGLPQGVVASNDSGLLVNRSGLRVGDEFQIGAEGRRLTTIKITEKDTLATLAATINRAMSGAGRAAVVKAMAWSGLRSRRTPAKPYASTRVATGRTRCRRWAHSGRGGEQFERRSGGIADLWSGHDRLGAEARHGGKHRQDQG